MIQCLYKLKFMCESVMYIYSCLTRIHQRNMTRTQHAFSDFAMALAPFGSSAASSSMNGQGGGGGGIAAAAMVAFANAAAAAAMFCGGEVMGVDGGRKKTVMTQVCCSVLQHVAMCCSVMQLLWG